MAFQSDSNSNLSNQNQKLPNVTFAESPVSNANIDKKGYLTSKNASRKTWIPEKKTAEAYKAAGVEYFEDTRDIYNRTQLQKCSYDYTRIVTHVYRVRLNDEKEFMFWNEKRGGKTGLGSPIKTWHMGGIGQYQRPIPEFIYVINEQTQQQERKNIGRPEIVTEYEVEWNKENFDDLAREINQYECRYYIYHTNRDKVEIKSFSDFRNKDFESMYRQAFQTQTSVESQNTQTTNTRSK